MAAVELWGAAMTSSERSAPKVMPWDEWDSLCDRLLSRMPPEWRRQETVRCGRGWGRILARLDRDLADLHPDYAVAQVKEKYGTLQVYVVGVEACDVGVEELVVAAGEESARTCETCGAGGSVRRTDGGLVLTACDAHTPARARAAPPVAL